MKNLARNIVATTLLTTGVGSAQSLYNLVPTFDGEDGSSPLQWTIGAGLGYDDNVNNGDGSLRDEQDSTFASAFIQATYANVDARTQWSLNARLGAVYFFDQVSTGGTGIGANSVNNRTNSDSSLNYSLTHRISDRLRFSSNGGLSYQLEPNLQNGIAANRQLGEFFSWQFNNSIGYEVNPRFGLVFGYQLSGITYSEFDIEDRVNHALYTQLRYQLSDRTVLTGNYRYLFSNNDTFADSTSHIITAGLEHRFSPTSVLTAQAGIQIRESDLGNQDRSTPFFELGVNTRLTPQLSARVFSRLMQEDGELGNPFAFTSPGQFASRLVWRTGVTASYTFTPQFSLNGGLTYLHSEWQDGTPGLPDFDEQTLNLNLGFAYQAYTNLTITGSYNFTTTTSDVGFREFDRNRFNLGVQTTF